MNQIEVSEISSYLSYDMKHADTNFDYEFATVNVHKERQLRDVSTDKFIELMFADLRVTINENDKNLFQENEERRKHRMNFLAYVYTYLNLKLKFELPQMLLKKNIYLQPNEEVYLLFKGGTMMYYKYEEMKKKLVNKVSVFNEQFDQYFKVSDYDFTVYITVQQRDIFYKVKKIANDILWRGLLTIRQFFERYLLCVLNEDKDSQYAEGNQGLDGNEVNDVSYIQKQIVGILTDEEKLKTKRILEMSMKVQDDFIRRVNPIEANYPLVQLRGYAYLIRKLLNMKTRILSSNSKLTQEFTDKFNDKINQFEKKIIKAFDTCKDYLNTENDYHPSKLLVIHEILCMLHNNIDMLNIVGIKPYEVASTLYKYAHYIETFIEDFAKHMQTTIIADGFYTKKKIDDLQLRVQEALQDNEFHICRSLYEEFLAFGNDTEAMIKESNYTMITLNHDTSIKVSMEKREDFYIQPDLLTANKMYTNSKSSNYHYMYQNSIIKKVKNNYSSVVDFDLLRIKFNLKMKSNSNKDLNIPSEFIDISICGYDDTSLTQFRNHTDDALALFRINGDMYNLECLGYSTNFMVHDLTHVLYAQNLFTPWTDLKYTKRIYRLTCLELLDANAKNKLPMYLKTLMFTFLLLNNCFKYIKDGSSPSYQKYKPFEVLKQLENNIVTNYKKYDFQRITHILPGMMIAPIEHSHNQELREIQDNENNNERLYTETVTDFSTDLNFGDEIIGSILFYSLLRHRHETGNESEKEQVKNIVNHYRKDFMFFPLLPNNFEDTMTNAKTYIENLFSTVADMYTLANAQITNHVGGKNKNKNKNKNNKKNKLEFF